MTTNKYDINRIDETKIREIFRSTSVLDAEDNGHYLTVYFNTETAEIWYGEYTGNSWTEYDDANIIALGTIRSRLYNVDEIDEAEYDDFADYAAFIQMVETWLAEAAEAAEEVIQ